MKTACRLTVSLPPVYLIGCVSSEHEIDIFLTNHEKSHGPYTSYSGLLSFCISDVAKPLLLHNSNFILHLVRLCCYLWH